MKVQLQLLTATVKLFLKRGAGAEELVQQLLKTATSECDNPDIRDRAYIYWRLLSASGEVARSVILSAKPPINVNQQVLSQRLLDELIGELGSLASVYHKPKDSFVGKGKFGADAVQRQAIEYTLFTTRQLMVREQIRNAQENPIQAQTKSNVEDLLGFEVGGPSETQTNSTLNILNDLSTLSISMSPPPTEVTSPLPQSQPISPVVSSAAPGPTNNMNDLLGIFGNGGGVDAFSGGNAWADVGQQNGGHPSTASKPKSTNEDILGLF